MLLEISDDFDPGKIASSGQCFRAAPCGGGWRFLTRDRWLVLRSLGRGRFEANCTPADWAETWAPYFDLGRDYAAVRRRIGADEFLQKAAAAGQGVRILRQDAWEMLVTFLISQRKSIPAIRTAVETLAETYGEPLPGSPADPEGRPLPHQFPTAAALLRAGEAGLRGCGLGYRAPYIAQAARRVAEGSLDLAALAAADDETIDAELREVKGVGPKVADCVLLFGYGRTGRVPHDTWIIRLIRDVYAGADPFAAYGADAGILQQYAFFYIQQHKTDTAGKAAVPLQEGSLCHTPKPPCPARKFSTARSSG